MATTFSTKEVAEKLGTDARTLRKFLRSEVTEAGGTVGEDTPGKGKRYSFESRQIGGLKKRFEQWSTAKAAKTESPDESGDEEVSSED